ncbi:MAG: putative Holliday junction resolvase [Actinomycetia bacterium]|nr:putative Holliday junction resolvase [Actinomycetes bacterium]
MRAVGIDFGSKRVGVAVSDATGTIASPHSVIQRSRSHTEDHRKIAAVVDEYEAVVVVVGHPISLDGRSGPAARLVEAEVEELRTTLEVPVELYDERFTTVTADRSMLERNMKADARRKVVDQVAAAVLLQSWLEGPGARRG